MSVMTQRGRFETTEIVCVFKDDIRFLQKIGHVLLENCENARFLTYCSMTEKRDSLKTLENGDFGDATFWLILGEEFQSSRFRHF